MPECGSPLSEERDSVQVDTANTSGDGVAGGGARARNGTSGNDASCSSSSSSEESSGEEDEQTRREARKQTRKRAKDEDDRFRRFRIANEHYRTRGRVSKRDGRLNISLHGTSNTGYLAKALGTAARKMVPLARTSEGEKRGEEAEAAPSSPPGGKKSDDAKPAAPGGSPLPPSPPPPPPPRLNIVIMVIGSRGDAQPFLKIARILHAQYGHRVRIATHPAFRTFVQEDCPGVEFFSVGGDPSELMAFMTKNPGMIPTLESVKAGDVGRRRQAMADMFRGFWRACINATGDDGDGDPGARDSSRPAGEREPFVADAIIANPPCFAHLHCAEALGVPLHLMFTFPYTPTQAFPHPLAKVRRSNIDPGYTNWISYPLVDMMVWQGLGDLVNDFRTEMLGLDPVSTLWAPGSTYRLHVPFTYLWSPGLVPKPADWGDEVDVAGFVFLDLASSFDPPDELVRFLEAEEEPPVYIGFGSIVVDDADRFTHMIFEAVKTAGVRALVSKGWGGLGGDSLDVPPHVHLLDNTPHDWLFPRVRACVIHGGAGTTAIALKCGKPTMVVPFFGDQHFWGTMVANAGAGPEPLPYRRVAKQVGKPHHAPVRSVRRARIAQGRREAGALSEEDRQAKADQAVAGWRLMRQLWDEMERAEKGGAEEGSRQRQRRRRWQLAGKRFGGRAKRLRRRDDWDALFEDVVVARRALDLLRRDGLDGALAAAAEVEAENKASPALARDPDPGGDMPEEGNPFAAPPPARAVPVAG
ncbi:hypothetical protein VTH06DRAFT_3377 [Thermothelomyces fergusii]